MDRRARMRTHERLDSLGRRHEADEPDVAHAALLEDVDRVRGAAAGREHRIDDDRGTLGDVGRKLRVVGHGLRGLLVAVDPDVADARLGEEREQAVHHRESCAQDRHDRRRRREFGAHGARDGRLDLVRPNGEVAAHFVRHQARDLVEQHAELLVARAPVAKDRQLVLDQRVVVDLDGWEARARRRHEGKIRLPRLRCASSLPERFTRRYSDGHLVCAR